MITHGDGTILLESELPFFLAFSALNVAFLSVQVVEWLAVLDYMFGSRTNSEKKKDQNLQTNLQKTPMTIIKKRMNKQQKLSSKVSFNFNRKYHILTQTIRKRKKLKIKKPKTLRRIDLFKYYYVVLQFSILKHKSVIYKEK